jgi:hypothetical protein
LLRIYRTAPGNEILSFAAIWMNTEEDTERNNS